LIIANFCSTIVPYLLVFRGRGDEGSWRQSGYGRSRSEEKQREVGEVEDREVGVANLNILCKSIRNCQSLIAKQNEKNTFKYTENRHLTSWILCLATLTSNTFLDHKNTIIRYNLI
jgi:hypothetical protein